MPGNDQLAGLFEAHRRHLRAVAYRMLGSLSEADDAVQEAWLRLSQADTSAVENLKGWLTTVVARVCLDALRSRKARPDEPAGAHLPDPVISREEGGADPERDALLADAVGLALLVVLQTLPPPERLAFVLHDMFALPFDEIAPIVGRTPTAARQLASRGRRRVQGAPVSPDADLGRQRQVVEAFLAASRAGSFEALVAVLDPAVVLRADSGASGPGRSQRVQGAAEVAKQALFFAKLASAERVQRPARVNGAAGVVAFEAGRPVSVMAFTVVGGRIVELDVLADPERLRRLDLAVLDS